jgi:hypothetical protein
MTALGRRPPFLELFLSLTYLLDSQFFALTYSVVDRGLYRAFRRKNGASRKN